MKLSSLTLSVIFASLASLTLIPAASAITWSVSGTFDDTGTISGTFDFDGINTYSNVNLTTTPVAASMAVGNTYTDAEIDSAFSNDLGLNLETDDFSFLMTSLMSF